jgi:hypothetical protein
VSGQQPHRWSPVERAMRRVRTELNSISRIHGKNAHSRTAGGRYSHDHTVVNGEVLGPNLASRIE